MASIKNLKSKGKAETLSVLGDGLSYGYEVRKMNAAGAANPRFVHPLRSVRRVYVAALDVWTRAVSKGVEAAFPQAEEQRYRAARSAARRGDGALVHLLAA